MVLYPKMALTKATLISMAFSIIEGVFDNRVVAEEKKNKLEEALERDGSDERIYIKYLKMNEETRLFYDTVEDL